jgi:hypothetical protein
MEMYWPLAHTHVYTHAHTRAHTRVHTHARVHTYTQLTQTLHTPGNINTSFGSGFHLVFYFHGVKQWVVFGWWPVYTYDVDW